MIKKRGTSGFVGHTSLVTCVYCLRILHSGEWVEVEVSEAPSAYGKGLYKVRGAHMAGSRQCKPRKE